MTALLEVQNLKKYYPVRGGMLRAVDDVSFSVAQGETLGLVGESGCGKSTLGRAILRLVVPSAGVVRVDGCDLSQLSTKEWLPFRRRLQIVFQDPFAALNPRLTVGKTLSEPLRVHRLFPSKRAIQDRVVELLELVGLSAGHLERFPHEFSGGQRQRIVMARALALEPELIVCDEPVSALDVSIQAQILNLLKELQNKLGLSYLFIAHDLGVVKHISHRVAVMYLGRIVEIAAKKQLYTQACHPYTRALLAAALTLNPQRQSGRQVLEGEVPSPLNPPLGCRFQTRCSRAFERCRREEPVLREVDSGHAVACHLAPEF